MVRIGQKPQKTVKFFNLESDRLRERWRERKRESRESGVYKRELQ